MARYQIVYWRHIPLGVKATDINGTVRENLPDRFQEAFQKAAIQDRLAPAGPFTTSGFRWAEEQEREGTAALNEAYDCSLSQFSANSLAAVVARELAENWDKEQSLASFKAQALEISNQFIDLNEL